jgi:small subunit ribosomal protein S16
MFFPCFSFFNTTGAQPSDRVAWILGKFGILPPKPRQYNPQKSKAKKEVEEGKK